MAKLSTNTAGLDKNEAEKIALACAIDIPARELPLSAYALALEEYQ